MDYFSTSRNFSSGGSSTALFRGAKFSNTQFGLGGSYDFDKMWRVFANISAASTSATSNDPLILTNNITRTNSGLNEGSVGVMSWFNLGPIALAPTLSLTYPFWRVNEDSEDPLLGEGAMQVLAGSWGIWRLGQFEPFVFAGYNYRDGGRSTLFPYRAGLNFRIRNWWIQGEYRGTVTVSDDTDNNDQIPRLTYTTAVNGGSFRYYAVNPESAEAAIETGFRYRGFGFYGGFATTTSGSNSADGNLIYAGISYSGRIKLTPRTAVEEHPEEQFEIEQDQYDETLFEEEGARKVKRKVRKQPSVDKLLHETEKDLQKGN
ncbi:MAG: hypothetical protein KF799_04155 [Bdellovibrionales bacterium]|nr:hypothetical protein [Bdellovibrionales bacterium]